MYGIRFAESMYRFILMKKGRKVREARRNKLMPDGSVCDLKIKCFNTADKKVFNKILKSYSFNKL